jgi:hypothetical protein
MCQMGPWEEVKGGRRYQSCSGTCAGRPKVPLSSLSGVTGMAIAERPRGKVIEMVGRLWLDAVACRHVVQAT